MSALVPSLGTPLKDNDHQFPSSSPWQCGPTASGGFEAPTLSCPTQTWSEQSEQPFLVFFSRFLISWSRVTKCVISGISNQPAHIFSYPYVHAQHANFCQVHTFIHTFAQVHTRGVLTYVCSWPGEMRSLKLDSKDKKDLRMILTTHTCVRTFESVNVYIIEVMPLKI